MSWNNNRRSAPQYRTDAYPAVGGGDTSPNNIVVMTNGDRIAVLSFYTTTRAQRVCTITLAVRRKTPEILDDIEKDFVLVGQQEGRLTLSVGEALAAAKSWLSGNGMTGEVL